MDSNIWFKWKMDGESTWGRKRVKNTPKKKQCTPDLLRQSLQLSAGSKEVETGEQCFHLIDESLKVK